MVTWNGEVAIRFRNRFSESGDEPDLGRKMIIQGGFVGDYIITSNM
jgi:hypothetical protein